MLHLAGIDKAAQPMRYCQATQDDNQQVKNQRRNSQRIATRESEERIKRKEPC
jgi:hypothetical protein